MKEIRFIMGMPVILLLPNGTNKDIFKKVFDYLNWVDEKFSTYKNTSEITLFNNSKISEKEFSSEMKEVFTLSKQTKNETYGYFDIFKKGKFDPSGLVKGWAIYNASKLIKNSGINDFYLEIAGDIEVSGKNTDGKLWKIGVRNPFKKNEIVKVIEITNRGIATSGNYERGMHIYNPKDKYNLTDEIASITVVGPNIYEADRFATAAFAMGKEGINFIENLKGFEGYMIDKNGIGFSTTNFNNLIN
jgi:thiamine biosynthesis lipoprotein